MKATLRPSYIFIAKLTCIVLIGVTIVTTSPASRVRVSPHLVENSSVADPASFPWWMARPMSNYSGDVQATPRKHSVFRPDTRVRRTRNVGITELTSRTMEATQPQSDVSGPERGFLLGPVRRFLRVGTVLSRESTFLRRSNPTWTVSFKSK